MQRKIQQSNLQNQSRITILKAREDLIQVISLKKKEFLEMTFKKILCLAIKRARYPTIEFNLPRRGQILKFVEKLDSTSFV